MSAERFRYKAFISYSHRDDAVARWLHGALESYRAPRHLIGRETAVGPIQKRLGPLFRDRDELPVAADLTGQINEALAATQFLIVLCSTASAQSKWVNQEVINFKRLKGAGSIIAIIVDGEPYASAKPGHEAQECFVPALRFQVDANGQLTDRAAEPIAADLRPGKDGKRMVKLKVLAGLMGVGLDELVQREAQRRQRFMTAVTFASLAGLGVMGALTFNALEARNEAEIAQERAERQKGQAEGLIEFMLGDLRKKLEPVGRLDVLDSVGDRALQYFGTLKADELDANTLGTRSRALHLLGEIQSTSGNLDKARESFVEANRTTAELLARDPETPQRIFDHAQSVYWLGYTDWQRGDKPAAEKAFAEYQRLAATLTKKDPGNVTWQAEEAYGYNNVGVLLFQDRRFTEAAEKFQRGREIVARLVAVEKPETSRLIELAKFDAWLADCARQNGKLDDAAQIRAQEVATYQRVLTLDPLNKSAVEFFVPSLISLGRLNIERGDLKAAISGLETARSSARALVAGDPDNSVWLELHARAEIYFGEAALLASNIKLAEDSAATAARIATALLSKDASILRWRLGLDVLARILKAKVSLQRGDIIAAKNMTTALITDLGALQQKNPKRADVRWYLAQTRFIEGRAMEMSGADAQARSSWKTGLATVEPVASTANLLEKMTLALLYDRLGRNEESARYVSELSAAGYRHPEIANLRERK